MLAPKAAKSDKGQTDSDRAPNGSSSDFSEDDTPLAVRLNTQGTTRPNDTGKPRIRPFLSKKGASFVIPRKKKQTNGNAYWDLLIISKLVWFFTFITNANKLIPFYSFPCKSELIQVSDFNSRDGKELLRNVEQSYRDPALGATFKFEKLELVHNDKLSAEVKINIVWTNFYFL